MHRSPTVEERAARVKNGRLERGLPAFGLMDQEAKTVALSDHEGSKLLLYFYPKADTLGCTEQPCSIRDGMPDLSRLGIAALGIRPDLTGEQRKFAAKYGLAFPLLSDPEHAVAAACGAWGEKSMYGRKHEGIIRSSFLIDEQGRVVEAWYKVSPRDTVPLAKEALTR